MEVSWFFLLGFFLYYSSSFSFDNHVATFFKEGVIGKRTIFFITSNFNITLLIFVTILVVVEHMSCCYYYCDYFGKKLRKKYVGKVSVTKMSYLWACS
jgi:membrane protein DedA with SNARE-associated domain